MSALAFRVTSLTARAVEDVGTSRITLTPSSSTHCRAMFEATSGLFWWSAERISTLMPLDRKSTRLNSSHVKISYAVFCLKKKRYQHPRKEEHTSVLQS